MKLLARPLLLLPVLASFACAAPRPPVRAPAPVIVQVPGQDSASIEALRTQWTAASNQLDIGTVVAAYAEDAVVILPDGTVLRGQGIISERWGRNVPTNGTASYAPEDLTIRDNLAFETGRFAVAITPASGSGYTARGRYNTVYIRQPDGAWRIQANLFSTEPPGRSNTVSKWTIDHLLTRYFGAIRASNPVAWSDLFAYGAVTHDVTGRAPEGNGTGLRQFVAGLQGTFETLSLTEDEVIIAGNKAAVRWTGRGRGRNGSEIQFQGVNLFEISPDGKIQTVWTFWDPAEVIADLQKRSS